MVRQRQWFHGQEGDHLEQMILHHIANRAGVIIEFPPSGDAEFLGHGDLHAVHIVAIPNRFEKGVCETEEEQVLDRLFPEVMVDAEDVGLRKRRAQGDVQGLGRGQISSERLFDDDACLLGATRAAESLNHRAEQTRRNGQVVRRSRRVAKGFSQLLVRCRILIVAVDVLELLQEFAERRLIHASPVLAEALTGPRPQLLQRPTGFGDTDDGSRQGFVFDHALQRGKDFLVCQVARRAKEHEGIGRNGIGRELELSCTARLITGCHRLDLLTPHILLLTLYSFLLTVPIYPPVARSTWPPNSKRMADRTFVAKSSSPRDVNR